jgi:hypothetical protein
MKTLINRPHRWAIRGYIGSSRPMDTRTPTVSTDRLGHYVREPCLDAYRQDNRQGISGASGWAKRDRNTDAVNTSPNN